MLQTQYGPRSKNTKFSYGYCTFGRCKSLEHCAIKAKHRVLNGYTVDNLRKHIFP